MANTGRIVWTELATPDPGAAAAFYAAALGWTCKTIPSPMGQGEYHLYSNGDGEVAGGIVVMKLGTATLDRDELIHAVNTDARPLEELRWVRS